MLPVLAIDPYGLLARLIKKEREEKCERIKCGNMGQFLVFLFVIYEILTLDEYVPIQEAVWVIKATENSSVVFQCTLCHSLLCISMFDSTYE